MKSMVIDRPMGADELVVKELPDLQPPPGRLAVDVVYAGVGYVDVLLRRGAFGDLVPLPAVPGLEVSGYVRAVGAGVQGFRVGQPVAAMTLTELGGYASIAVTRPELTVPLDGPLGSLDLCTAAASIVNLTTAYMALGQVARLRQGDHVLVHGAAGGLGSFIGQMARHFGAGRVYGTVGSAQKLELASSLGYDELFLREGFAEELRSKDGFRGLDLVLDPVGGEMRRASQELLRPLGQLVVLGNASGAEDVPQSMLEAWLANRSLTGFSIGGYSQYAPSEVGEAAKAALHLLADGVIRSEVFGVYPLEKASEAHELLETKNTVGKLVLQISG
ncbi:alcohol dehydrogenase zinc-binding domain-containing protein [Paenibacillus mucilaginosus 3016]|uniref:Alcohol dehydrogenase zinc-binding domain-containing protein n=1 Tax=Paenibacillus mucilaginosus 3016 TaxID=1116391 RepID=H6NFA0_9BACL|nr:zinc-binding dehydrogenase [Paenibacillus mucilaginosus]AFC29509.1 alcohol dehydrogenase zinc-binding domain-containing protein [Paenibacillus mucilaginosus 3016]WFA18211.1 alcohol dehydrogenase [Paenibacillus mucilaginosus]